MITMKELEDKREVKCQNFYIFENLTIECKEYRKEYMKNDSVTFCKMEEK